MGYAYGFGYGHTWRNTKRRVAVAGIGGGSLLDGEANGFATDFIYPVDAQRVSLKASGTNTYSALDSFYQNAGTSPKMVYDASGVLGWSPHNLLQQSQTFEVSNWAKVQGNAAANVIAAPNGALEGDSFTPANIASIQYMSQPATTVVGVVYTFSVYVKNGTLGNNWIDLTIDSTSLWRAWFNLATGAKGTSVGSPISYTITDAGTGWYRIDVTFTAGATSTTCYMIARPADGSTSPVTTAGTLPAYYAWAGQFNRGPVATAYLPTTTAVRFGLAIDYDPVTHAAKGLLCELAATNVWLGSSSIDNASWWTAGGGATLAANAIAAPTGALEADAIIAPTGTAVPYVNGTWLSSITTGQTYTLSAFVKNGTLGNNWVSIGIGQAPTSKAWFNLSTGVKGSSSGSAVSYNIKAVGNGWYRIDLTFLAADVSYTTVFIPCSADNTGGSVTGDGVKPAFYLWGAQCELGTIPTSHIPTFGASVTRAGNLYNVVPASINYSATAGSWWVDVSVNAITVGGPRILGYENLAQAPLYINSGTTFDLYDVAASLFKIVPSSLGSHKVALAFQSADRAMTADGLAVATSAAAGINLGSPGTGIFFGSSATGTQSTIYIRKLRYVPRRKSNAELQTETIEDTLVGGGALLAGERDGFATDFFHPVDAERVTVKALGAPTNYAVNGFYNNDSVGSTAQLLYNSTGGLSWSPHNMLARSEEFDLGGLVNVAVTANAATAPSGIVTADKITNSNTTVAHHYWGGGTPTTLIGQVYTIQVWAKAAEWSWIALGKANDQSEKTYFDLANGVVGNIHASHSNATITPAAGGYYCTITWTSTATNAQPFIYIQTANGQGTVAGVVGSGVYLWGAQLNRGSVPVAYLPTAATARVGLGIDYDPVTLIIKGLSCEPIITNLCLWSSDLTNAAWVKTTMTAALTATGPIGQVNSATTLTATSANATTLQTLTSASAARITSVFIKRRTGSGNIDITQDNGSTWVTQTVTSSWARYSLPIVTSANPIIGIRVATSGDAVDVALWQNETATVGAPTIFVATSPIPTFGATVTKANNFFNFTPAAINHSGTAGSWWIDFNSPSNLIGRYVGNTASATPISAGDATNFQYYDLVVNYNKPVASVAGSHKVASAFQSGSNALTADGLAVATGVGAATGALAPGANIYIGSGASSAPVQAWIRKVRYVPRRKTNPELVTETT